MTAVTQGWTLLLGILLGVLFTRLSYVHTALETFDASAGFLTQQQQETIAAVTPPTLEDVVVPSCPPIDGIKESVEVSEAIETIEPPPAPILPETTTTRTGFCRRLPAGQSATTLWNANEERILRGTKADLGLPDRVLPPSYPTWLPKVFELLSARFLRLGYKNPPQPATMKLILDIVDAAMQNKGPPLNIAVLGGSVTQGRGSCFDPVASKNKETPKLKPTNLVCNWPMRLQAILDEFLGPNTTIVTNLAVGGTSTSLSTSIVKYRLYYADQKNTNYDVIINAYSTNDALPTKANHTYDTNFQRSKRDIAQNFIQACQESRPCSPDLPLVIYVDDYVGNQNNLILAENTNGWLVHEICEWTGTMFVSYASAVRRLTLSNQWETLFSGYWPWWSDRKEPPRVNVHFSMSAHMSVAWVLSFCMLSAAVDYCDDHSYDENKVGGLFPQWFPPVILDLVERVPPPRLDADTKLQLVSDAWLEKSKVLEKTRKRMCGSDNHAGDDLDPCALSFVCGPTGTIRNPSSLALFLRRYTKDSYGWEIEDSISEGGWSNKLGYSATKANASTTFVITNSTISVQAIKVYYLRSYGEKWDGAKARFSLTGGKGRGSIRARSFELKAYHNSNTSISYEHELDLGAENGFPVGSNVELRVDVISGSSFKITGLVMCNRP